MTRILTADLLADAGVHTYIVRQVTAMQPGSKLNVWYQVVTPECAGYYSAVNDTWFRLVDTGRVSQYNRRICRIEQVQGRAPVGPDVTGVRIADGMLVEAEATGTHIRLFHRPSLANALQWPLLGDGAVKQEPLVPGYAKRIGNDGPAVVMTA